MRERVESETDRWRRITAAAIRAVSGRDDVAIAVEADGLQVEGTNLRVAVPGSAPRADEIATLRGQADVVALRLRHHDPSLHRQLAPTGETARSVFDALEDARIQAIGTRQMAGVAANLAALLDAQCRADGFADAAKPEDVPLDRVVALLAREQLTGEHCPQGADRVVQMWRTRIDEHTVEALSRLALAIDDQRAYASCAYRLMAGFGLEAGEADAVDARPEARTPDAQDDSSQARAADASESEPAPGRAGTPEDTGDGPARDAASSASPAAARRDDSPVPSPSANVSGASDAPVAARDDAFEASPYRCFTTRYDEVVEPVDLCDARELRQLRRALDRDTAPFRAAVHRLAARLQQKLLARQAGGWDFDREEGLLDSERLAGAIVDPFASLAYKVPKEIDLHDTVVSLLIDNSGSMLGLPIRLAAMSADIVAAALERCAIQVEILGFTTREWRGGRSREQWLACGKPPHPGRLNDLRHIVYKRAETPWRRARNGLALMLQDGLLKENVDGEALRWAYRRLLARPEARRILMVLSDGAPSDDSTLSANPGDYLVRDLRDAIARIERDASIELTAIGIGHDVSRYYRRAVTLVDARDLGATMLESLTKLFDGGTVRGR